VNNNINIDNKNNKVKKNGRKLVGQETEINHGRAVVFAILPMPFLKANS
jgi:hypothetical protein